MEPRAEPHFSTLAAAPLPPSDSLSSGLDSLSLAADGGSSLGSDSEINGGEASLPSANRYGFVGGSNFTGEAVRIPAEVIREREKKWLDTERDWERWITRRYKKIMLRCRKGIPASMRSRIWPLLCGAKLRMLQNKNIFKVLDESAGDRQWLDAIEKDLHRQFPFHEMFLSREGTGQQDLYRVLKAYTVYKPEEGYCQAQGPLAAVLLMQMPAEEAFWCLVQICEHYVPGYYSQGLEAVHLDGQVLDALLKKVSPAIHRHLRKHEVDPVMYMTEWFMCLFTRTLPWATMLRVWDMFLSEGVKVIFRVALFILKVTLGSSEKLKDCQGLVETLERLRTIPQHYLQDEILIREVSELGVTDAAIDRETSRQRKKMLKAGRNPPNPTGPRLHGARAVYESARRPLPLDPLPLPLSVPTPRSPSAPAVLVSPPPPAQEDPRARPAGRSRTFYVRRPSRPPQVPPRREGGGGQEAAEEEGGGIRSKRFSEPLCSDTYF